MRNDAPPAVGVSQAHDLDFAALPGYRWMENGQSVLSGALLELYFRLDRMFTRWASDVQAEEMLFPVFLPARELAKLDYFRSFPHLATFACTLAPDDDNLANFSKAATLAEDGAVPLTRTAPVRDVLTPAACYHVYVHMQGTSQEKPRYVTTRCTCFRREAYYAPLQRQWSFSMREIVCVGTAEEVKDFLSGYREKASAFFERSGLAVDWLGATDPFFDPSKNPKHLLQKLEPVKTEMVFQGKLAIGSTNFHRNFFGETFGIRQGGREAFSGCVAFGVERWIYALLTRFGPDIAAWPHIPELD